MDDAGSRDSTARAPANAVRARRASIRANFSDFSSSRRSRSSSSFWSARQALARGRFFVERYVLYQPPGPLLRLFLPSGSRLWAGAITHAPWPLRRAKLVAYGGMCSAAGVLSAVGLSERVQGASIAHTSSGVGPIEFVWRGAG